MKKLSLLFVLSFGLLAQAAQNSEQDRELSQNTGTADTALEQAEGADLKEENAQEEDTKSAELDSFSSAPKYGSRHTLSFLAGLTSGLACEFLAFKASGALMEISSGSLQRDIMVNGRVQTIYGFGDTLGKPVVDVTKCLTALRWAVSAGHVVLPAILLKKLYKEKKDVKYTKATIATSAALAAVGTYLTWIDLD
jgi:hypothetical protein